MVAGLARTLPDVVIKHNIILYTRVLSVKLYTRVLSVKLYTRVLSVSSPYTLYTRVLSVSSSHTLYTRVLSVSSPHTLDLHQGPLSQFTPHALHQQGPLSQFTQHTCTLHQGPLSQFTNPTQSTSWPGSLSVSSPHTLYTRQQQADGTEQKA